MIETLRADLTTALKSRDEVRIGALRSMLAAIANAEAVPVVDGPLLAGPIAGAAAGVGATEVPRRELSAADIEAILRREIDDRVSAAAQYTAHGRGLHAQRLHDEVAVLQGYLLR